MYDCTDDYNMDDYDDTYNDDGDYDDYDDDDDDISSVYIYLQFPSSKLSLTVPPIIIVNYHTILYSDNIKYVGVYFDRYLYFHRNISNLLRYVNCNFNYFCLSVTPSP